MFKKILLATTSSPTCKEASNVAIELAKKHGSKLYIFHALGFPTRGFGSFIVDFKTGENEYYSPESIGKVQDEIKQTYAEQLKGLDNYVIETMAGVPHTEILRLARKENIELIVMGPHAKEEKGAILYRSLLGSTMQEVTMRARCPVMIVSRPVTKEKLEFKNIVFGTDFSKQCDAAFKFAYDSAKELGSTLYLFHALDITPGLGTAIFGQNEIDKCLDGIKDRIQKTYTAKIEGFDNYKIKTWEGIPYMEIVKFARRREADLIVMAHHSKEKDPDKAIIGSTMEQVVMRASCPVVSVNRSAK